MCRAQTTPVPRLAGVVAFRPSPIMTPPGRDRDRDGDQAGGHDRLPVPLKQTATGRSSVHYTDLVWPVTPDARRRCPERDSNPRQPLRHWQVLYPLSYRGLMRLSER